jgi:hypothetical protein
MNWFLRGSSWFMDNRPFDSAQGMLWKNKHV